MKEKNFQQEFKTKNTIAGVFELKLCKGTSFPFSNIADHQITALQSASSEQGLYHKLTDQPVSIHQEDQKMRFTRPAPFDCFLIKNYPAYLVVMYYVPRVKKMVYYLKIEDLIKMIETADRKSMTEKMAIEYAEHIVSYKKVKEKMYD